MATTILAQGRLGAAAGLARRLRQPWPRAGLWSAVLVALFPLAYGFFAVALGQDNNFDLHNYHFVNPWWFFTDHMRDFEPAHTQSYLNPLLDAPFHLLATHLPGVTVGFLLGVASGLTFPFLYLIARRYLTSRVASYLLAALGMFTAGAWGAAGNTMGDAFTAPLFLCGLWLVLCAGSARAGSRKWVLLLLLAGLAGGGGAGLKLSGVPWTVATMLAAGALPLSWCRRVYAMGAVAAGTLAAVAVTYGWWGVILWQRYRNPFFPYFNNFFHSPWAAPAGNHDLRFVAHGLLHQLFYPFYWTLHYQHVSEVPFRELTLPVIEGLLWLLLASWVVRLAMARRHGAKMPAASAVTVLAIWAIVGYALNTVEFGIYRYLLPVEELSFVFMVVLVRRLLPWRRPVWISLAAALVLVALVTEQPMNWGRVAFADRFISASIPQELQPPVAILTAGPEPLGFIAPLFPVSTYFASIDGANPLGQQEIGRNLSEYTQKYLMWAAYQGPPDTFIPTEAATVAAYGLKADPKSCTSFDAFVGKAPETVQYCRLLPNR